MVETQHPVPAALVAPASLGDWIASTDDPGTAEEARASESHLLCEIGAARRRNNGNADARGVVSAADEGVVTSLRWWSSLRSEWTWCAR